MDQESDWARQWAVTTGRCVKRWRAERKLSAQKLADKCAFFGMPSLTRTVITKLENGRKESVSTAELMVLARSLDVPPVMLMFPFGDRLSVEITPGEFVSPLDAAYQVAGIDPDSAPRAAEKGSVLDLFMMHRQIVDAILTQRRLWQGLRRDPWIPAIRVREVTLDDLQEMNGLPPLPAEIKAFREMSYNATLLRNTRDAIHRLGFEPPPLPPGLNDPNDDDRRLGLAPLPSAIEQAHFIVGGGDPDGAH